MKTDLFSLRFSSLAVLLLFNLSCGHTPPAHLTQDQDTSLAVMQGLTTSTSTQVAVLTPKKTSYQIKLFSLDTQDTSATEGQPTAPGIKASRFEQQNILHSDYVMTKVWFEGLRPNQTYLLEIKDSKNKLMDARELQTLDTQKNSVRFAVVSCMDDTYQKESVTQWQELLAHEPEMILMIGDNAYADKDINHYSGPAPAPLLWKRYLETRLRLSVFRAKKLVPVLATWDDHDYGANDGNRDYAHKKEALKVFNTFFAQKPLNESKDVFVQGPGVSSRFTAFGQRFYLTDDRSFRSPKNAKDETHWGVEQEKWILKDMDRSDAPAWLISGDQFFGEYHRFESYQKDHPKNFKKMMKQLGSLKAPIVLVSGDRHLAELMAIPQSWLGYPTYEITTSAIHAKTFPGSWKDAPNPLQIVGESGPLNFAIIDAHARAQQKIDFDVAVYAPGDTLLFKRSLSVKRP